MWSKPDVSPMKLHQSNDGNRVIAIIGFTILPSGSTTTKKRIKTHIVQIGAPYRGGRMHDQANPKA